MRVRTVALALSLSAAVVLTGCSVDQEHAPGTDQNPKSAEAGEADGSDEGDEAAESGKGLPADTVTKETREQWARQWDSAKKTRTQAERDGQAGICVADAHSWYVLTGLDSPDPDLIGFGGTWKKDVPCNLEQALVVVDLDSGVAERGTELFATFD